MAKRRCRHCPTLVPADAYKGMCPNCRRATDQARGTRTQRGYGAAHQTERAQIAADIRAGKDIRCVTCNQPLTPDFHYGHTDDRTGHIGPQCPLCNDSEAGKKAHRTPQEGWGEGQNP